MDWSSVLSFRFSIFSPAGDRWNDRKRVARVDGGGFFLRKIANVFVVQIQVNKSAHPAFAAKEVLAQFRPFECEGVQGPRHGGRVDFDLSLTADVLTERSRDEDDHVQDSSHY